MTDLQHTAYAVNDSGKVMATGSAPLRIDAMIECKKLCGFLFPGQLFTYTLTDPTFKDSL